MRRRPWRAAEPSSRALDLRKARRPNFDLARVRRMALQCALGTGANPCRAFAKISGGADGKEDKRSARTETRRSAVEHITTSYSAILTPGVACRWSVPFKSAQTPLLYKHGLARHVDASYGCWTGRGERSLVRCRRRVLQRSRCLDGLVRAALCGLTFVGVAESARLESGRARGQRHAREDVVDHWRSGRRRPC